MAANKKKTSDHFIAFNTQRPQCLLRADTERSLCRIQYLLSIFTVLIIIAVEVVVVVTAVVLIGGKGLAVSTSRPLLCLHGVDV